MSRLQQHQKSGVFCMRICIFARSGCAIPAVLKSIQGVIHTWGTHTLGGQVTHMHAHYIPLFGIQGVPIKAKKLGAHLMCGLL